MALTPFNVERFGGLNLVDDPLEVGATGAVDLLNVWIQPGRVETVPEISGWASPTTRKVRRLFNHANTNVLASESDGSNVTLEAFDVGGTSVATGTYASASTAPHCFASIGTPTASRAYAVRRSEAAYRWNGSAWASVATIPVGSCCAPADNGTRLAVGMGLGVTNAHRVYFSAAGDPESFNTADPGGDWVDIAPGDGEAVIALIAWRGMLFAFKNSKFAVFEGVGTDADGGAEFNYRMVEGKGMPTAGLPCATSAGVFFMAQDGVYLTTGGPAVLVSRAISPLWTPNAAPPNGNVSQITPISAFALGAVGDDVYLSCQASLKMQTLVLRDGEWTYLTVQASGTTTGHANVIDVLGRPTYNVVDSTTVRLLSPADGPDPSIAWSYKSGKYALAPGSVAITPETSLVGTGTVTLRLDSDLYTNQNASATLGAHPTAAEGWPGPVDQEGTWLQYTLSATGEASVSRLTHLVSSVKPVGVR